MESLRNGRSNPLPPPKDILLCALNTRYPHSAFGLRYLFANLRELQNRAEIVEFVSNLPPREIVERLLSRNPKIIGFGVYIWNAEPALKVISILKQLRPDIQVVLGGPEVSHETEEQTITKLADYVIVGEADLAFYDLAKKLLIEFENGSQYEPRGPNGETRDAGAKARCAGAEAEGDQRPDQCVLNPSPRILKPPLPTLNQVVLPYDLYSQEDIDHRIIYVEASRGCPFRCEYCLSSLDTAVRNFELEPFLSEMDKLIARGARRFKFVDRTFNLSPTISRRILQFFIERIHNGLFLHFELVPDRLPPELKELLPQFPEGSIQFEIGIQTWNAEVSERISRRQDYPKIVENFEFLRMNTKVHIHSDLIAGLPGESLESFSNSFDQLLKLAPHEIQLGILKKLRGTPISRHQEKFKMIFQEEPPYQILSSKDLNFFTLQKLARFSRFWDLYANSGNFTATMGFIRDHLRPNSFFWWFWDFSDFLAQRHPEAQGISLMRLFESMQLYLTGLVDCNQAAVVAQILSQDYQRTGRREPMKASGKPQRSEATPATGDWLTDKVVFSTPRRQMRHRQDLKS